MDVRRCDRRAGGADDQNHRCEFRDVAFHFVDSTPSHGNMWMRPLLASTNHLLEGRALAGTRTTPYSCHGRGLDNDRLHQRWLYIMSLSNAGAVVFKLPSMFP